MRVIILDHEPDGERLFVFETIEEREEYFARANKQINESQAKSLADLRQAYMSNTAKVRRVRSAAGRQKSIEAFDTLNGSYKQEIKKVYDLYARVRANLQRARDTCKLESELQEAETIS